MRGVGGDQRLPTRGISGSRQRGGKYVDGGGIATGGGDDGGHDGLLWLNKASIAAGWIAVDFFCARRYVYDETAFCIPGMIPPLSLREPFQPHGLRRFSCEVSVYVCVKRDRYRFYRDVTKRTDCACLLGQAPPYFCPLLFPSISFINPD